MKFEVTLELIEEMAHCIVDCNLSGEEASEYMKSCVTGNDSFDPESNKHLDRVIDIQNSKAIMKNYTPKHG